MTLLLLLLLTMLGVEFHGKSKHILMIMFISAGLVDAILATVLACRHIGVL